MENVKKTSKTRPDESINFTLKVKSNRRTGSIELSMDLNPESRLIGIDETFSSHKELIGIFDFMQKMLDQIEERTVDYNETLQIDEKKKKKLGFNEGYDQNFKPSFGKIDKIIHRHNSPGESAVSYARSYNGDKQPH
jgi:hypothetical protein